MHASGTKVTMIHQCRVRWACHPGRVHDLEAIGSTMAIAEQALGGAWRKHLGHGHQPDRAGRLDPGPRSRGWKPNSCAMASAIDCTPWNMTEIPTTPGTKMVAKADCSAAVPLHAADALPDLREDVEEDEAQEERLDDGPQRELPG